MEGDAAALFAGVGVEGVSLDAGLSGAIHCGDDGVGHTTSGKIIFDGKEVSPNAPIEASVLGIAMIHQELSLSHTLSVAENIFQARQPKGRFGLIDKKKLYADSRALLDQVGLKDMDPSTLVRNINVSQQQ